MTETRFEDTTARWQAVRERIPGADGRFVYAVRTTRIYCRPTCPSRRPKRENVLFFGSPALAEAAGYRACKRCTPDAPSTSDKQIQMVRKVCELVETSPEPPQLTELADAVGVSRFHLHRVFKDIVGVTPKQFAAEARKRRLQADLEAGAPVADAIYAAGYGSSSRVYENANNTLGMTPAVYRDGAKDVTIRYTVTESPLGLVLVAATDKGICSIALGDSKPALDAVLRKRFPKATLVEAGEALSAWVKALVGFIRSPARGLDLPLDIQGTAFQQRVWQALQAIPVGHTASYQDIARAIGEPRAARAVAQACASNNIALAIPCHRVIRQDGSVSGYRWGVERKRRLLDEERRACPASRDESRVE